MFQLLKLLISKLPYLTLFHCRLNKPTVNLQKTALFRPCVQPCTATLSLHLMLKMLLCFILQVLKVIKPTRLQSYHYCSPERRSLFPQLCVLTFSQCDHSGHGESVVRAVDLLFPVDTISKILMTFDTVVSH